MHQVVEKLESLPQYIPGMFDNHFKAAMRDYAIDHHKIIGNWENRQTQRHFHHYQSVQKQLLSTAREIGGNGPQQLHALTGLFFLGAIVAPNLPPALPARIVHVSRSPQHLNLTANSADAARSGFRQEAQLPQVIRSAHPLAAVQGTLPGGVETLSNHTVAPLKRHRRSVTPVQESPAGEFIAHAEMAPDAPSRSVMAGTASPCPERGQDTVTDLNDASQYVIALLEKNNALLTGCDRRTHAMVISAIAFSERDSDSHAALASAIQKARGHYGGDAAETLHVSVQKRLVRDWVARTIFGDDIGTLLRSVIQVAEKPAYLTIRQLSQLLKNEFSNMDDSAFSLQEWLVHNVILEQLPILRPFFISDGSRDPDWQHVSIMKLHDFEFGQINAGLLFARSLEQDPGSVSVENAAQWGKILLAQLQEGAVPLQWWSFFQLHATIRYTQDHQDLRQGLSGKERQDMDVRALIDYSAAYVKWIETHDPVAKFKKLMAGYTTRPQFAKQLIDAHCPGMDVNSYLNHVTVTCLHILEKPPHPLDRLSRPDAIHRSRLPDINQVFQSHVDEIADSYQVVDELLIMTAWSKLADEESYFIHGARVIRAWAEFSAADELNFAPVVGGNLHARQGLQVSLAAGVELFVAQRSGQPDRTYALQHMPSGYLIKRVDRDRQHYLAYLGKDKRPAMDASYKLRVYLNDVLKSEAQGLGICVEHIAQKHHHDFSRKLYQYGFNPTVQETIKDVMLSFIPFYTCLTSDDQQQAALSCTIDTLSLFPVLGELSAVGIKVAEIFTTAGLAAARIAATEMARRGMLQEAIRLAGPEFIRYASSALNTITREEAAALLVTSLRTLDPGIELIGSMSSAAVRQSIRLGKSMTARLDLYARLDVAVEHLLPPMRLDTVQYGKLPGVQEKVSVMMLGGDRFHGMDVYVRIYPDTRTVFGRKYVMWPDGSLEAIPVGMARRLKNIFEQGLSGRGAVKQAANWAASAPGISAALLRQIRQDMANGVSLESLASRHQVSQELLRRYISPDAILTPRGQDLMDAAEAGPSPKRALTRPYGIMQLAESVLAIHTAAVDRSMHRAAKKTLRHLTPAIPADENVRSVFSSDGQKIQTKDHTCFTYDIDLDVFRMDASEESSFVYLANPAKKSKIQALTMQQAIKRKRSVSLDQRTAVVKALGIDLDFSEILTAAPFSPESQTPLPKIIRYVWVGDRAIASQILENLRESAKIANNHGYQIRVYLSEKSRALNLERLKEVVCDLDNCLPLSRNKVHILEESDFFKEFRQSDNFAQYQDALEGNGGVATNFASAADILRYALVQKKGGLYMDMDDELLDSLGSLELKAKDDGLVLSSLLSAETFGMHHQFGTSFFGAHKGNTVLKDVLQEIHRRYQQEQYRNFYKIPRPPADDGRATRAYIGTLFSLTGPGVFNDVMRERLPGIKHFMELSKLDKLSHHAYTSDLFRQLSQKIPGAQQITPLANTHIIGNLHSWQHYR